MAGPGVKRGRLIWHQPSSVAGLHLEHRRFGLDMPRARPQSMTPSHQLESALLSRLLEDVRNGRPFRGRPEVA